jgi:hypothetical protein
MRKIVIGLVIAAGVAFAGASAQAGLPGADARAVAKSTKMALPPAFQTRADRPVKLKQYACGIYIRRGTDGAVVFIDYPWYFFFAGRTECWE